jgi:hypothetical protein
MENNWLTWIASILNTVWLLYAAWKKFKPELKKMDTEGDIDILKGAEISNQMLVDRINEMKAQREADVAIWKGELQQEREARKAELAAEKEARKKESDYLRRRIKEAEREARDYRSWAAKLVKQVVNSGQIPAEFVLSLPEDSETGIPHINAGDGEGTGKQ